MNDEITKRLEVELKSLRDSYITANPRQRLKIIMQRINRPSAGPNVLVTLVGCIESLSRSLVMHLDTKNKDKLRKCYSKYRNRKPQTLVEDYCRLKGKEDSKKYFGEENWKRFILAIGYRNLLAHESTYLANYKFMPLEEACREILKRLAKLARLKCNEL